MLINMNDRKIEIANTVFLAPNTFVIGSVSISDNSGIWFGTVIRGDGQPIHIGENTNIQENCVLHSGVKDPIEIGDGVTIGHSAVIHGCKIGNNTTIGMHSTIMNGAEIGENCIVGAGALVTEGKKFGDNLLILGVPARAVRSLSDEEITRNHFSADLYVSKAIEMKDCLSKLNHTQTEGHENE